MNSLTLRDVDRRLLMAGVILCLLVAVALLAPRATSRYVMLLVAGLGGLLLLDHPQWGLMLLIPVGLCVPFSIGTGTKTEVPMTILLLVALLGIWVWILFRERVFRLVESPANWPLVALVVVAGLSILVGQFMWNPLVGTKSNFLFVQLAQWAVFVLSAGAFWLVANMVHELGWLKLMVWVFLAMGAVYMMLRILPGGWRIINPLFVSDAIGSLFWVWLVALAWGQVLFNRRLRRPVRLALLLLVVATLYVAWFAGRDWVSGWGPPSWPSG